MVITTKYIGATGTSGSKIVAKGESGQRTTPYPWQLTGMACHSFAAWQLWKRDTPRAERNGSFTITMLESLERGYRFEVVRK